MAGILSIRRCSNRKLAVAALAIGCFLLGFANLALSQETRLIRFVAQERNPAATQPSPPIIDLHFHFNGSWDIDAFVERMDALGVTRAGNAPYGAPDALALEWAQKHTGRFIPFAGKEAIRDLIRSEGARAWNLQAPAVLAYLQQLDPALKAGNFKGIGEINVYPGPPFPGDSPLMQRLWSLSAEHQVPLSIHLDARDEPVA